MFLFCRLQRTACSGLCSSRQGRTTCARPVVAAPEKVSCRTLMHIYLVFYLRASLFTLYTSTVTRSLIRERQGQGQGPAPHAPVQPGCTGGHERAGAAPHPHQDHRHLPSPLQGTRAAQGAARTRTRTRVFYPCVRSLTIKSPFLFSYFLPRRCG